MKNEPMTDNNEAVVVPCPICAVRPGRCMKLCVNGKVNLDALGLHLLLEVRAETYAEMGRRAPEITAWEWKEKREVYINMARIYCEDLREIYAAKS